MKVVYYRVRKTYTDVDKEGWKYFDITLPSKLKVTEEILNNYHSGIFPSIEKKETILEILFEQEQYETTKF